ncbi:hypothetical protein [Synechococcus sp. PCC 6312]|uniref:hypothetical protein n=1 Tax=Synechococcus sp. (strain ATCC 27167 / PCC 6312) TaxID=195253 RepID=UPI00029F3612|nr:hypothetical protein [Synechococcus sp. PCC 6312]AFY60195.1 hypothetical protein Syn6312_0995 [Synechococcus sp. PCC 6312]
MASSLGDLNEEIYDSFLERIEIAVSNNIPAMSRFMILGEISYAVGRGDITIKQGRELERLLGLKEMIDDYAQIREQGFWGELNTAA